MKKLQGIFLAITFFIGFGVIMYGLYTENNPISIIGGVLTFGSLIKLGIMSINETREMVQNQINDYNKFIDHLVVGDEKSAYNILENMKNKDLNNYMLGIMLGRKLNGEELKNIKK